MKLKQCLFALLGLVACSDDAKSTLDAVTPDAAIPKTAVTIELKKLPTSLAAMGFAYYDAGVWNAAPAPANGMLTLQVQDPTFVLAIGCDIGTIIATTDLHHRSTTETQAPIDTPFLCQPDEAGPTRTTIGGVLTNVSDSANTVALGDDDDSVDIGAAPATTGPYEVAVLPGTRDIIASQYDDNGVPTKVLVERGYVVGATNVTDKALSLASGVVPTIVAQPGDRIDSASTTILLNGTVSNDFDIVDAPYGFVQLPASLANPADLYRYQATQKDATGAGDVTVTTVAAAPAPIAFEANVMAAPTIAGQLVNFVRPALAGSTFGSFAIGSSPTAFFYIESGAYSDAYLAANQSTPRTDFSALTWPAGSVVDRAEDLSVIFTVTSTTGTRDTAGFRAVEHSNEVTFAGTAAKPGHRVPAAAAARAASARLATSTVEVPAALRRLIARHSK